MNNQTIFELLEHEEARKVIEDCCGKTVLLSFLSNVKKNETQEINIVNTGLVSSGKSSLFNALIDRLDDERFPTGAARTTLLDDRELFQENVWLVDTPGIDVKEADDKKAYETLTEADVILFVHNVNLGELRREEVEWLKKIKNGMKKDSSNIIFVCSWVDERDQTEDYSDAVEKIRSMIGEIFSKEVEVCCVSAKRYRNGMKKKADGEEKAGEVLISKSGMEEFRRELQNQIERYQNKKYREEALKKDIEEIEKGLEKRAKELQKNREKREKMVREKYSSKKSAWKDVFDQFVIFRKDVKRIEKELEELG